MISRCHEKIWRRVLIYLRKIKMKDPVKITIEWYSNSAEHYKRLRSDLTRDEENRTYFLEHLSGKKILDIGCAHGRDICEFFKKGKEVSGIDLTPEFISIAKESCPEADIQLMDMRNLTFENEIFDGIRACASFLHIPKEQWDKTIKWFHRVLKKWWVLFIGVMEWSGEWFDERSKYQNVERFFSYREKNELEQLLKDNNFSIQKSYLSSLPWSDSIWLSIFATAK